MQESGSSSLKIKYVDDDKSMLNLAQLFFTRLPLFDLQVYSSPTEILNDELSCDGFLLDVNMPEMNGLELFDELRTQQRWKETPIAFLTGHTDPEALNQLSAKTPHILSKPFTPEQIDQFFRKVFKIEA